ncbi:hypothetical protein JCM11251_000380 [Rhodosporidiobolus azoricus]
MESSSISNGTATPFLPPGHSHSHLPAPLALSTPSILRLVLLRLVDMHTSPNETSGISHYASLRSATLVNRSWAAVAQPILFRRKVVFTQGDTQLKGWLYALECLDKRVKHTWGEDGGELRFVEKEEGLEVGEREQEGKKWSKEVMGKVMSRVTGVRMLVFAMQFAQDLPGEWLASEGLKDLTLLATACPFTAPSKPIHLPFKLVQFTPVALNRSNVIKHDPKYSSTSSATSWQSTFALLSPAFSTLAYLDMEQFSFPPPSFPCEAAFFPFLFPCRLTLTTLELPALNLHSSSYRLALFAACGLPSLTTLIIFFANAAALRELLPYFARFAPQLKELAFRHFRVPLGAGSGIPSHLLDFPDPAAALIDVLSNSWPTREEGGKLELVQLGGLQVKDVDVQSVVQRLGSAAKRVRAKLFVFFEQEYEMELSDDEKNRFAFLHQRAQDDAAKCEKTQEVQALLANGKGM